VFRLLYSPFGDFLPLNCTIFLQDYLYLLFGWSIGSISGSKTRKLII